MATAKSGPKLTLRDNVGAAEVGAKETVGLADALAALKVEQVVLSRTTPALAGVEVNESRAKEVATIEGARFVDNRVSSGESDH